MFWVEHNAASVVTAPLPGAHYYQSSNSLSHFLGLDLYNERWWAQLYASAALTCPIAVAIPINLLN